LNHRDGCCEADEQGGTKPSRAAMLATIQANQTTRYDREG
jgi:hypothetical protein